MNKELYKPQVLKRGDRVALVNPVSLPPAMYRDDRHIEDYLRQGGFVPVNCISDSDGAHERVRAFNRAIALKTQALLPVTGNHYGIDIFEHIDYEAFEKNRPIFCSFSAASALLLALHFRSDVCVFYGPHISFLQNASTARENGYTTASFWNMLTMKDGCTGLENAFGKQVFRWDDEKLVLTNLFSSGKKPAEIGSEPIPFIGEQNQQTPPVIQGTLLPAFLQSFHEALKAGIKVDFTNKVVLTEMDEVGFDRGLELFSQIADQSNLDQASAVFIANFVTHKKNPPNPTLQRELYDPAKIASFLTGVKRIVGGNVPVMYGFPMGHTRYKLTVPMGVKAQVNIENGDIQLLESPFSESEGGTHE